MAKLMGIPASIALSVLSLLSSAMAQGTSTAGNSPTSTSRAAATYTIKVGLGHQFQPDYVQALPGDSVKFNFMPLNHSVVRAEYLNPCIPYEKTGPGKVGFFSGFHPATAILDDPPSWTLLINDTDPILFYCSAPGSCINYQMVGIINPNATTILATQKELAGKSKFMLQPGEDFPAESTATTSSTSTSATSASTAASTAGQTVTATPTSAPSKKSGLPAGAIAGIAVGAFLVLALAAALMFFVGRSKTLKETVNRQSQMSAPFGPHSDTGASLYQVGGFAPVKGPDFQRQSQVGTYEVPQYGPPGNQTLDPNSTGYARSRDGGSPPPAQFYQGQSQSPLQEYRFG